MSHTGLGRIRSSWFLLFSLAPIGCGGDGTSPDPTPDPTELRITVGTTGEDFDLDGYVLWQGSEFWQVPPDTVFTVEVSPGSYTLELEDLADNCSVPAGPEMQAVVGEGQTVGVSWAISCTDLPPAATEVTGTWTGHLSDCECHTIRYVLEQVGDQVPTALVTYANTLQGIENEFIGRGRVSGTTLTIFYQGRRQLPTLGPFVKVMATLVVDGDQLTGKESEQMNLWGAESTLTRQ